MGDLIPLSQSAINGDVRALATYLHKGLVNNGNNDKENNISYLKSLNAFHLAYMNGHKAYVRMLLEADLDVDSVNIKETLPFRESGHLKCLSELLFFKVYRNALKSPNKWFIAQFKAAYKKDFNKITTSLQTFHSSRYRKDIEKNVFSFSELLFLLAYYQECSEDLFQELITNGADVDASFYGYKICIYAALCGNANCLKVLLQNGCCFDGTDNFSFMSPFHCAIRLCHEDCLCLLLEQIELHRLKVWQEQGSELLAYAVRHRSDKCVSLLLKHGACIDSPDGDRFRDSPLSLAIMHQDTTTIDILLQNGADVNWTNDSGESPLIYAALWGCSSCISALIDRGANINAVDSYNETALMHAVQRGNLECFKNLLSAGADVSIVSGENQIALSYAITLQDTECLRVLLSSDQCRKDTLILNKWHKDAFQYALRQFHLEGLLLLVEHGIFTWKWLEDLHSKLPTEILARLLIAACVSPGHFSFQGRHTTLLQRALADQNVSTAFYLMSNLYLSEYDYRYLRDNTSFISSLKAVGNSNVLALLQALTDPLSLQTLSFLTLSTSMPRFDSKIRRRDLVNSLPIPDKIKTVLKFESPFSEVCVPKWQFIGTELNVAGASYSQLLAPFKKCYLQSESCSKTDKMCSCDVAADYRARFDILNTYSMFEIACDDFSD